MCLLPQNPYNDRISLPIRFLQPVSMVFINDNTPREPTDTHTAQIIILSNTIRTKQLSIYKDIAIAFLAAWLLMGITIHLRPPVPVPSKDAADYARLALGLSEFNVLGYFRTSTTSPRPDPEVMPLYPAFLSALIHLDQNLHNSLVCNFDKHSDSQAACPDQFSTVTMAQGLLMAIFLLTVWCTGWQLSRRRSLAWIAMIAAWSSGLPVQYATQFLTETLVLPLFGALLLLLAMHYLNPTRSRWALYAGLTLGLLVLTRPSFAYLFWLMLITGALSLVYVPHLRQYIRRALIVFCLGYIVVTAPWLARNYIQFDQIMFSGGKYGGKTLAQRVSYNDMSTAELAVSFIYWFPDIGDTHGLAKSLFPAHLYARLGWDKNSYYRAGDEILRETIKATKGTHQSPVTYLVKQRVLNQPLKHTMVSVALTWRGIFIKKYWGIMGWVCSIWLLGRLLLQRRFAFIYLWSPALFLVVFHAAVSVSIPRYNTILLPLLSIGLAYVAMDILSRRFSTIRVVKTLCDGQASEFYPNKNQVTNGS